MSHPSLHGLDLCWSSLQALLDELSDDQWSTQSLCPDWDVAGVVMHLIAVEEMLLGRPPSEFAERLPFDEVAGFTDAMSKLTHSELAEKFRTVMAARKAELAAMSDAKWRWFDAKLGNSNNLALGRFTFADLLMFAFANFGFTIGWKLPEGTDNLARFVETHNQRECAAIWQQAE